MRKITYIITLAAALALTACDDYLDVSPSDKQTADQLFANKAGFYTAANGIYNGLSGDELYGKQMTWEAVDIISQSYAVSTMSYRFYQLQNNTYSGTYVTPVLSGIWGKAYEMIMAANLLIDRIDQQSGLLTQQEANCLKGEMLAVRAFLHLDMLRLFGPSPLYGIDKLAIPYNESSNVTTLDLVTVAEADSLVLRDLDAAEQLLATSDPVIENGPMMSEPTGAESVQQRYRQYRMNYYAVIALKARAYNWVGDAENAMTQALRLINDEKANQWFPAVDPNQLLANTSNPDRVFSSEALFAIYDKDRDQIYENYFSSSAPAAQHLQPFAGYVNSSMGLFGNLLLGAESYDYRFQSQWEQASGVGAAGHVFTKYKKIDQPDPSNEDSEYYYAKMIPLVTMQEMYYIACESAPSDAEKVDWYNQARVRRGCPDLAAMGMLPTIAAYWPLYGPFLLSNEIRREFWGTGQWLYFTKHVEIGVALELPGPGAYYYSDCGAAQTYGQFDTELPLPAAEMK